MSVFIRNCSRELVLCAVFSVSVVCSWPAPAQASPQTDQQPTATFQASSELVLVPVVVTDSKGKRVTDLSADDFAIFEGSKQHPIKHFDRIHGKSRLVSLPNASGLFTNAAPQSAQPPSITIVLLDSLNTSALDQKNAIEQIAQMLLLPFPGPVAVWQLGQRGIVVVQDFTSDPEQLALSAQRFRTARSTQDLLNTTAISGNRPYNFLSPNKDYSGTINPDIDINTEQRSNELALEDSARQTLEIMLRVAKAMRQLEGRKSLFWATGGLSSRVENEIGTDLSAANVSVYPIEVTPNKGSRDSPVYFNDRVRYRKSEANGLRGIAEQTGGTYCPYVATASDCLAAGVADASDYYMLAFAISSRFVPPGPHPIEVRIRRPNLHVRARSAYFVEDKSKEQRSLSEIASAMDSPLDLTNLPFAIRLLGRKEVDSKLELSFRYAVPNGVLEPNNLNHTELNLSFAATAFENNGKPAGAFSKDVSGSLPAETEAQLAEKGFLLDGAMQVPPSATLVRFVIRDNITGRLGSISVPLGPR